VDAINLLSLWTGLGVLFICSALKSCQSSCFSGCPGVPFGSVGNPPKQVPKQAATMLQGFLQEVFRRPSQEQKLDRSWPKRLPARAGEKLPALHGQVGPPDNPQRRQPRDPSPQVSSWTSWRRGFMLLSEVTLSSSVSILLKLEPVLLTRLCCPNSQQHQLRTPRVNISYSS